MDERAQREVRLRRMASGSGSWGRLEERAKPTPHAGRALAADVAVVPAAGVGAGARLGVLERGQGTLPQEAVGDVKTPPVEGKRIRRAPAEPRRARR